MRVARIDGKLVINPYKDELARADIDMLVAGTASDINMMEGEMGEISEEDMVEALKFAHDHIKKQIRPSLKWLKNLEHVKIFVNTATNQAMKELSKKVYADLYDKVYAVAKSASSKKARTESF